MSPASGGVLTGHHEPAPGMGDAAYQLTAYFRGT
jgi:hypothetical protein